MNANRYKYAALSVAALMTAAAVEPTFAADPYAKAVVFSRILPGNSGNNQPDPARALGPSDASEVSLGGPGASIILDMGQATPIQNGPGPDLEIREVGAAYGGVDESFRVLVSNSTDTNSFVYVGTGRALSLIDINPAGFSSARYVWLQDLATETLNTGTPGSDIDSVRVLFYTGSDSDVQPPIAVSARPTGQGIWLSWLPSTHTNLSGYAIRRSLDGISFGSSPDATLPPQETAWHDISTAPYVGNFYYALSSIAGSQESTLAVIRVSGALLPLQTNSVSHLGDDAVPGWEDPSPDATVTVKFELNGPIQGPEGELVMDVFDVDNSGNAILLNGAKIGSMPIQSAESWVGKSLRFPSGALLPGTNTLTIAARNSSGGVTGSLDDFQIRNVSLRTFGVSPSILAGARLISISAGQTNVTLDWVVEEATALGGAWQPVSDPIRWSGNIVYTNGYYRLREVD